MASGGQTYKTTNGKKIKPNTISGIAVTVGNTTLTYRMRENGAITDLFGDVPKDNLGNLTFEQILNITKESGNKFVTYTQKELEELDEKRKKERANRPDYELGYGTPWGMKQYAKGARRNRLATRTSKRGAR